MIEAETRSKVMRPASDRNDAALLAPAVPPKYPERWLTSLLVLVVVALLVRAFVVSPNIDWNAVGLYLTYPSILKGIGLTIFLTLVAQALGIAGGLVIALMRLSPNGVLNAISLGYIWLFRGTPQLIQIIIWFNIGLIFPTFSIGIPFTEVGFSVEANSLVTPITAAILGLGLNETAYMAEIIRGGVNSVNRGQLEAAASIGMTRLQAMRKIILPQAMRAIVPPTGNEFIAMLKATSLVSVIATQELLTSAQQIYATNFLTIELLLVASFWYLVMTSIATVFQSRIEAKYSESLRVRPKTLLQKILVRFGGSPSKQSIRKAVS